MYILLVPSPNQYSTPLPLLAVIKFLYGASSPYNYHCSGAGAKTEFLYVFPNLGVVPHV